MIYMYKNGTTIKQKRQFKMFLHDWGILRLDGYQRHHN
jgi:hypothetical protein